MLGRKKHCWFVLFDCDSLKYTVGISIVFLSPVMYKTHIKSLFCFSEERKKSITFCDFCGKYILIIIAVHFRHFKKEFLDSVERASFSPGSCGRDLRRNLSDLRSSVFRTTYLEWSVTSHLWATENAYRPGNKVNNNNNKKLFSKLKTKLRCLKKSTSSTESEKLPDLFFTCDQLLSYVWYLVSPR